METIKPPTTLAILDGPPLITEALQLLLQESGYVTIILDDPLGSNLEELLRDVQLLILTNSHPILYRKALLEAVRSTKAVTKIPVLELITASSTKDAEAGLGYQVPWPCQIEDLKRKIEVALLAGPSPEVLRLTEGKDRGYSGREEELREIIRDFDAAWNARDVEGVLAFYTDDVVYRMGPAPFTEIVKGKQQMRSYLKGVLPGFRVETWDLRVLDEERVTSMFRLSSDFFRNLGIDPVEGRAEAIFEGDRIKYWNITATPETFEKAWAAMG